MSSSREVRAAQEAAVDAALAKLDLDAKAGLLAGQDTWSLPAIEHIGLESLVMSDGPIGVRGRVWSGDEAVALPSPTAQAASWDPALARRSGRLLAQEARRKGVHVLLAPTINLHRSPLGGRHFEAQSEDPLLTGEMAASFVVGVQDGGVATTVKHFVANDAETQRMTVNNVVDERTLREIYLAPFETVVRAGAWGVMSAYNSVNGATMTENSALQNDVLRGEWGFDGFVVSDWTAARDSVRAALGGTDSAMPGPQTVYGERLAAAVREGRLSESVVDSLARRVLLLAARVGALSAAPASVDRGALPEPIDGREHAREVARRSFVLLKNEPRDGEALLPLRGARRVALIGLPAAEPRAMGGGSAQVFPPHIVSPLDGLREALGDGVDLDYVPAMDARTKLPPMRADVDLSVEVSDSSGAVRHREPAAEGQVNWMGEYPGGLALEDIAAVRLSGTFTPRVGGRHEFSVAGAGVFELAVDGMVLFSGTLRPDSGDVVTAFVDPPEHRVVVDLAADVPIELSVRRTVPAEANIPENLLARMVSFRIGHADPLPDPDRGIADAVAAAPAAELAIVAVATTEAVESEGFDRRDLRLPGRQDELVERVAAANPNTIVVVSAGSPVEMPWAARVPAILLTWFGGQEFGAALADVLTGAHEPGGRLPTTWPKTLADAPVSTVEPEGGELRYDEGIFVGYRGWQRAATEPAFWFGHGLGYTDWDYAEASFAAGGADDELGGVAVTVTNTGDRGGREVVQVYLSFDGEEDDRPACWLAGFTSVSAAAAESATATVSIPRRAVQVWDPASHSWRTRPGAYTLRIGHSLADIRVSVPITVA